MSWLRLILRRLIWKSATGLKISLLLMVGMGVNGAFVAIFDSTLLQPLSYDREERTVWVYERSADRRYRYSHFNLTAIKQLRQAHSIEQLALIRDGSPSNLLYTSDGVNPQLLYSAEVSPGFFSTIGAKIHLGRPFSSAATSDEVIISHRLWNLFFGGTAEAINRTHRFNGLEKTIVGVVEESYRQTSPMGGDVDVWMALETAPADSGKADYRIAARLRPKASIETARIEADTLFQQTKSASALPTSIELTLLKEELVHDARSLIWLLGALGVLLMMIVGTNAFGVAAVSHLGRVKEAQLREALGATRRQLLLEELPHAAAVAFLSGVGAVFLHSICLEILKQWLRPDFPRIGELSPSILSVASIAATALLAFGILVGASIYRTSRSPNSLTGRSSDKAARLRLNAFVVGEMALTTALLLCAGLIYTSYRNLSAVPLGYVRDHILALDVHLPFDKAGPASAAFFSDLMERLGSQDRFDAVALTSSIPLRPRDYKLQGGFKLRKVSSDYFRLLRIPLLVGRTFKARDDAQGVPVALISRTSATQAGLGLDDAVGSLLFDRYRIIGVVEDVHHAAPDKPAAPAVYLHYLQAPDPRMSLLVKERVSAPASVPFLREAIRQVERSQPITRIATLNTLYFGLESMSRRLFLLRLLGLFAGLSILSAMIGVWIVAANRTRTRQHEIAIRMALGARPGTIISEILKDSLRLIGTGILIGLLLSQVFSRFLDSSLYGVSPQDPWIAVVSALVLVTMGLLGCLHPAITAIRFHPARLVSNALSRNAS